jgi:NTE family protein
MTRSAHSDTHANRVLRTNLALQGGGSHGAFAWGVLERLLDEEDLDVPAVVGASAGAVNATLLVAGLCGGGRKGAKCLLESFWKRLPSLSTHPFAGWPANQIAIAPGLEWLASEFWTRALSPYQFNPWNWNPLRELLDELVDFSVLRKSHVKLFLCATNVLTGELRVFDEQEIGVEHVLASACLPTLFQAVQIGDDFYWDGGFMGNPPIFPVIYNTECSDVLIVQINPTAISRLPKSPQEIADRINTLSFNSSFQRELHAIDFVSRLVREGVLDPCRFKELHVHVIEAESVMRELGTQSKHLTDARFLGELRALGRSRASEWLVRNRGAVGRRSTMAVPRSLERMRPSAGPSCPAHTTRSGSRSRKNP